MPKTLVFPESAAQGWVALTQRRPPLNRSVLVSLKLLRPTYDVAVYLGRTPQGDHHWILADIRLEEHLIEYWAEINDITEEEE